MADTDKYESISPTAKLVAWWRSFSDIPYAKDVSSVTKAEQIVASILAEHGVAPSDTLWGAPLLEIRYKSLLREIKLSGIRQILELASGVSLRGLVMTVDPNILYVETDLPGITAEKKVLIDKILRGSARNNRPNLILTEANALVRDEVHRAMSKFSDKEPVVIVNEGLIHYLNRGEQESLMAIIAEILKQRGGIWLTPDFEFRSHLADWHMLSKKSEQVMAAITQVTGRRILDDAFETEIDLRNCLKKYGLSAQRLPQWDESMILSSAAASKIPEQFLATIKAHLGLWKITYVG